MFKKYYCPKCKEIMSRSGVKRVDEYYSRYYIHKYCGAKTRLLDHHVLQMDEKINKLEKMTELHDLKSWVDKEAIERYPQSGYEKKAFKAGVYALLDKIGFDYGDGGD